ncbi:MAG: hypothetical protein OEW11_02350 [Nitrospirota bacterium]|nr:hypothetical protein [Nitrospirota bacterium]
MTSPAAYIPLERDPVLSIPFRVHCAAGRMVILNTFGTPYRQQLLVVDTATQEILGRWRFEAPGGNRLFHLDAQLTPDGRRVVLVGGELLDDSGNAFAPDCVFTRIDVDSGEERRLSAGPLGFNYVSACPDGATALSIYNGNNGDQVQFYELRAVDLESMTVTVTRAMDAPVNNVLYRSAEGRALVSVGREVRSLSLDDFSLGERACPRFNHPYLLAQFTPDDPLIYAAYVASRVVVKAVDVAARSVAGEYNFSWPWTASTNVVPFGTEYLIFPPSSSAGAICLWNRHDGLITHKIALPGTQILSTPHPDGERLYLYDYTEQRLMLVDAASLQTPVPQEQGRGW